MKKEILQLGKALSKRELKTVHGGGDYSASCGEGQEDVRPEWGPIGYTVDCYDGIGCFTFHPDGTLWGESLCEIEIIDGFQ